MNQWAGQQKTTNAPRSPTTTNSAGQSTTRRQRVGSLRANTTKQRGHQKLERRQPRRGAEGRHKIQRSLRTTRHKKQIQRRNQRRNRSGRKSERQPNQALGYLKRSAPNTPSSSPAVAKSKPVPTSITTTTKAHPKAKLQSQSQKTTDGAEYEGKEADVRTTTTSYSGQENLGWLLRKPTSTTAEPSGLKLTRRTYYNRETGVVVEERAPEGGSEPAEAPRYSSEVTSAAPAPLGKPSGVAVSSSGDVWVADKENSRVEEFSATGAYITQFGKEGSANGDFDKPRGIALDAEGHIWVADTGNFRVEEMSSTGTFIRAFGSGGTENGQFEEPSAITIDSSGNVWVTDSWSNRVQEFSATGTYLRQYSALDEPEGIAANTEGDVWVTNGKERRRNRAVISRRESRLIRIKRYRQRPVHQPARHRDHRRNSIRHGQRQQPRRGVQSCRARRTRLRRISVAVRNERNRHGAIQRPARSRDEQRRANLGSGHKQQPAGEVHSRNSKPARLANDLLYCWRKFQIRVVWWGTPNGRTSHVNLSQQPSPARPGYRNSRS